MPVTTTDGAVSNDIALWRHAKDAFRSPRHQELLILRRSSLFLFDYSTFFLRHLSAGVSSQPFFSWREHSEVC